MYRPPNTQVEQFSNHIKDITNQARSTSGKLMPELVIGMDHNIDLLKGMHHAPTHGFIELMSELNLLPMITRPSRITHHSATLIDNIYVSEQLHRSFESIIIIDNMSDHLPLVTMLKQTKVLNKEPIIFLSCCLNEDKLKKVSHLLM